MPLYCNSFIGGEAMRFAAARSTFLDVRDMGEAGCLWRLAWGSIAAQTLEIRRGEWTKTMARWKKEGRSIQGAESFVR
jgi:hypothetical protein